MSDDERPFTVLVLNPMGEDGWGGVERWLMDLAVGLRSRGCRVLSVGRPGSLWTKRCLEAKFETKATPMRGGFPVGEARAVAYWMQEQGVDVVCTKLHKGIRLGGLAARFAGHKPLVAFMGLVEVESGWRHRFTYRFLLHRIVTRSEGMRRDILAVGSGVPPERVVAIPYGVRPADYAAPADPAVRASLGGVAGEPLVVSVGRLHDQKRFDLLLEAFAAGGGGARLAIVGTGALLPGLQAKARALGIADRVRFAGFRADIPAVLAAGDLFALASDDEGLPMVVIEAMASGRAVVATDVGSVRDLVVDGTTGVVVPRRDPAALGEAMKGLLADDGRCRAMGEAGRARVRERYPLDRCVAETEAYLRWVAGRGGPTSAVPSPPPRS